MRMIDIIIKKRDKYELTSEEISFFIEGYTKGEIPDYQASALVMAILLNGMGLRETTYLTLCMAHSGKVLDLSTIVPIAVDKHSTGGVGDKTSLVVGPTVSACGLPVGKMSGRGLGFSGGTLDKLESIPGYRCDLTTDEFIHQLKTIGLVLTGQTADMAPADGKLYSLRDVTGTVQSIPLIASSIMSKKIAAGAQAVLLDVKVGSGAFMTNLEDARRLADLMVKISSLVGKKTIAILSDMNQPLGEAVGNALELKEALDTLHGGGPKDFKEHCLDVSGYMLALGGLVKDQSQGKQMAEAALAAGQSFRRFREMVQAQGGDINYVDEPDRLPRARLVDELKAPRSGYIAEVNARKIGELVVSLGGGREQKGDTIDHSVGVIDRCKVGDKVNAGDILMIIHANDEGKLDTARRALPTALAWSDEPVKPLPLYYGTVD